MKTKIRLSAELIAHLGAIMRGSRRIRVVDSDGGRRLEIEFDGEPWIVTIDVKRNDD